MLRSLENGDFALDAEEPGEPILEMRRERDQELRFLQPRQRRGIGARGRKPCRQACIGVIDPRTKRVIDPAQAGAGVEVVKGQSETGLEHQGIQGCTTTGKLWILPAGHRSRHPLIA